MRSLLFWFLGILLLAAGAFGAWYGLYVSTPAPGRGAVTIVIPKGAGVRQIGALLAQHNLIRNDIRFLILARFTHAGTRLQAGEFSIPRGLQPAEVLDLLARGKAVQHHLTIPEGLTMAEIATLFADKGWVNTPKFLALCRNPTFIHELGIQQDQLEGYLFPDTYALVRGKSDAKSIISTMVRRFQRVWKEIAPKEQSSLTRHQIVTLASIVEKETANPIERPLIARVFLNRLDRSMRLQSDPTVIYGLPAFNGNLTRKDLRRPTPYNTYVIYGLPPGPICNPGRAAMAAILHPADSTSLYFVSKNNGSHQFSATLQEHNRAVHKYQKKSHRR